MDNKEDKSMKKVLALILCLSVLLGFASCAKKVEVPSKSDVKKAAAEEYDMEFKVDSEDVSDDEKEAEWVLISKDGTLEVTVTWNAKNPDEFEFDDKELSAPTTTTTTEETDPTTTETETDPTTTTTETSETSGDGSAVSTGSATGAKYVNFDEMNFYIKGKKYTLGKTTLQELVDDGVPFMEGEAENFSNNVKSHYQSGYIKIDCGVKNGNYFWIEVFNDTDAGKPMNECYVNELLFKFVNDEGKKQTLVSFDFPFNLTMGDLKANAGEPNGRTYHNEDNAERIYDTLEWTKKGTKFMNSNRFEFNFVNDEFREINMTYIP